MTHLIALIILVSITFTIIVIRNTLFKDIADQADAYFSSFIVFSLMLLSYGLIYKIIEPFIN